MKTRKFDYIFVVQGHYGQGWEDLCASESWTEARGNLRDYRENAPEPVRIIKRREPRGRRVLETDCALRAERGTQNLEIDALASLTVAGLAALVAVQS